KELHEALAAEGIAPATAVISDLPVQPHSDEPSSGRVTNANQTAATMVGESDEVRTAEPRQTGDPNLGSQAGTIPTMVAAPRGTDQQQLSSTAPSIAFQSPVVATPRKSSPMVFVGAGLLVLLLLIGGGGFAAWRLMSGKPAETTATKATGETTGSETVVGGHEVGRYWLQVNTANKSEAVQAGQSVAMNSGEQFKFHFSPSENGYLYIVGPGIKNAATTFLTARPATDFGVKTNEVKSGQDFIFPADTGKNENWLNLDKSPGSDEFTIIFA